MIQRHKNDVRCLSLLLPRNQPDRHNPVLAMAKSYPGSLSSAIINASPVRSWSGAGVSDDRCDLEGVPATESGFTRVQEGAFRLREQLPPFLSCQKAAEK